MPKPALAWPNAHFNYEPRTGTKQNILKTICVTNKHEPLQTHNISHITDNLPVTSKCTRFPKVRW